LMEYHRTFGELGAHVKRALSHRSRALRAIVPKLLAVMREEIRRGRDRSARGTCQAKL